MAVLSVFIRLGRSFSPFEKPQQKIDDADGDQQHRHKLRGGKKGNKGVSAVVRARKFDKKAPNAVPDAIERHQRKFVFSPVFEKQNDEHGGEGKEKNAFKQLNGHDAVPNLFARAVGVIIHVDPVPGVRFPAVAAARRKAAQSPERMRQRNAARADVQHIGKTFYGLVILAEMLSRDKINEQKRARPADQPVAYETAHDRGIDLPARSKRWRPYWRR